VPNYYLLNFKISLIVISRLAQHSYGQGKLGIPEIVIYLFLIVI
jgi:hypothetical protein